MSDEVRTDLEFVDVYVTVNPAEATFIKDLLDDNGITHLLNDQHMSAFPTGVGNQAEIQVEVDEKQAAEAIKLLQQARKDGAITEDGNFV